MKALRWPVIQCGTCGHSMTFNGYQPAELVIERGFQVMSCEHTRQTVGLGQSFCLDAGKLMKVPADIIELEPYDPKSA